MTTKYTVFQICVATLFLRNIPRAYNCVITVYTGVTMEFTEIHVTAEKQQWTLKDGSINGDKSRNVWNLVILLGSV